MSYCINPDCSQRQNPDEAQYCKACGTQLSINNRYRLVKPLRSLKNRHHTEVFEVKDKGTPKVIKILQANEESLKLVELFEQEAKVLRYLKHSGIPKAELGGYFTFLPKNGEMLRCLVMEKIEGQDLERWARENGTISEDRAIDWLRQIANILDLVHQNKFFHRDIKPSNIMRRPEGQLVLIDFGTAREVSQTVIDGRSVTIVYSHGYTAPEQFDGRAVPQSDFFALGRTFVYLLTGKQPNEFKEVDETAQLIWRDKTPNISKQFADLLDNLMAKSPKDRPQDATVILQRLGKIVADNSENKQGNRNLSKKWLMAGLGGGFALGAFIVWLIIKPPTNTSSVTETPCFTDVSNVPKGIFNYGGSTSWAPISPIVDSEIKKAWPEFGLRYQMPPNGASPGSSTGIKMLLDGQLSIAQASYSLSGKEFDNENQQAKQKGFALEQQSVALDAIAVAVNPQINIPGLTIDQLRDIYNGKIRNWQQVGGPNIAIAPYSRSLEDAGTVRWFKYSVLNNQDFNNKVVKFVSSTTEGIRQVADRPGSIYYASAPEVVPQCLTRPLPLGVDPGKFVPPYQTPFFTGNSCSEKKNQINYEAFKNGQYPLTRNLFVIFKDFKTDNEEAAAGRAYVNLLLTDQGQRLIEKAGFVRIRFSKKTCPLP